MSKSGGVFPMLPVILLMTVDLEESYSLFCPFFDDQQYT